MSAIICNNGMLFTSHRLLSYKKNVSIPSELRLYHASDNIHNVNIYFRIILVIAKHKNSPHWFIQLSSIFVLIIINCPLKFLFKELFCMRFHSTICSIVSYLIFDPLTICFVKIKNKNCL